MKGMIMSVPDTPSLVVNTENGVIRVCIDRPETRNAMNEQVLIDLFTVFDSVRSRGDVRALVLRGAGGNFCAGADIKDMARLRATPAAAGADQVAACNRRVGDAGTAVH